MLIKFGFFFIFIGSLFYLIYLFENFIHYPLISFDILFVLIGLNYIIGILILATSFINKKNKK
ncbi:MAG: hypothetical protein CMP39_05670 [Rickettsiales bacterium]|nr:hypothetical protein [Rickettsiales bacterium]